MDAKSASRQPLDSEFASDALKPASLDDFDAMISDVASGAASAPLPLSEYEPSTSLDGTRDGDASTSRQQSAPSAFDLFEQEIDRLATQTQASVLEPATELQTSTVEPEPRFNVPEPEPEFGVPEPAPEIATLPVFPEPQAASPSSSYEAGALETQSVERKDQETIEALHSPELASENTDASSNPQDASPAQSPLTQALERLERFDQQKRESAQRKIEFVKPREQTTENNSAQDDSPTSSSSGETENAPDPQRKIEFLYSPERAAREVAASSGNSPLAQALETLERRSREGGQTARDAAAESNPQPESDAKAKTDGKGVHFGVILFLALAGICIALRVGQFEFEGMTIFACLNVAWALTRRVKHKKYSSIRLIVNVVSAAGVMLAITPQVVVFWFVILFISLLSGHNALGSNPKQEGAGLQR